MYAQVSISSACPAMCSSSTNGSSVSARRAKVLRGSSLAQRTATSKSKPATSVAELQIGVDFAAGSLERLGEIVLQRDARQRELDQIGVGLDPGPPLGLLDERPAHPARDAAILILEQT